MKFRTIVVDDEKPARDRIKRFLAEHADFEVVGEAGDGESAVRVIEELRPDLVFLDVRMPEADGFEVLQRLSYVPRVVFATAYERYAVQAFEVHSIDYLLKPFDRKRFGATLARVRQEMRKRVPAEEKLDALLREIRESTLALRGAAEAVGEVVGETASGAGGGTGGGAGSDATEDEAGAWTGPAVTPAAGVAGRPVSDRIPGKRGPRIYLLAPQEILWFEADGELVFARSGAHRYLVSRTLADLEASLDPKQFFRSHRSFIVNLAAIAEIVPEDSGNYRIVVRDPERTAIPLSRRQARKLREVFPW
jgi:DNA-binding LytR/AlgR family response regulator